MTSHYLTKEDFTSKGSVTDGGLIYTSHSQVVGCSGGTVNFFGCRYVCIKSIQLPTSPSSWSKFRSLLPWEIRWVVRSSLYKGASPTTVFTIIKGNVNIPSLDKWLTVGISRPIWNKLTYLFLFPKFKCSKRFAETKPSHSCLHCKSCIIQRPTKSICME